MKKLLLLLFIPCLLLSQDYPFRGNIVPHSPNTNEIGLDTLRWEKLWVSQLEATVFAKQSISLVGGFLRLGKNTGVLESPCYALYSMNFMNFGQNMTIGDIVEFREAGQVEYVRVLSFKATNQYYVARNLDGTGVNYWKKGSPYSVVGQAGNGWIDLQSYGNTKISMYAVHDTTYNNWNEILRIGDLNGNWGYSGEQYGMVVGSYSNNSAYLTIDTVNGIRLRHKDGSGNVTDKVRIEPDGDSYFTGNMTISNAGSITISSFNNDAGYNHVSYQSAAPSSPVTGDMYFDTDAYLMYRYNGATWDRVSIYMDANGLYARTISADSITAGTITGSTLQTSASGQRVVINGSDDKLKFYDSDNVLNATLYGDAGGLLLDAPLNINSSVGETFYVISATGQIPFVVTPSTTGTPYFEVKYNEISASVNVNIASGKQYQINGSALTYSDVGAAASGHNHTGTYAPAAQGATYSSHSATSGRYVATSSGGSPTTQMGWVVLTINGVSYTVFTSD